MSAAAAQTVRAAPLRQGDGPGLFFGNSASGKNDSAWLTARSSMGNR
ncbi:hypothetical protein AB0L74_31945 [Streptomyces sp. NPDC052020]